MVLARTPAFTPLAAVTTLPAVTGEHASRPGHLARDFLDRVRAELQTRHEAGEGGLALLDARYLAGDEALYAEFETKMFEEVWSHNPTAFFKEKLAENTERHARAGDSVYLLQPQLKEGQGGLRDLHTALWMAKVKFKVRSFRELVTLGQIAERDVLELEEALDFLWRIRNALHLASDRP